MEQTITHQPATQTNTSSEKRPIICLSLFFAILIITEIVQSLIPNYENQLWWGVLSFISLLSIVLVPLAIKHKPFRYILLCMAILIIVLSIVLPVTVIALSDSF